MANGTPIYTDTLSSKITITSNQGIFIVALLYISGTVTVQGDAPLSGTGLVSTAISLSSSSPSLTIGTLANPINNLTIDASSGSCQIICYY